MQLSKGDEGVKLRIEIDPAAEAEVVIRSPSADNTVYRLSSAIEGLLDGKSEIAMFLGDVECYVPCEDILFFETADGKISAHTHDRMFSCRMRLHELSEILPRTFVRGSKSCLINTALVFSVQRSVTGASEVTFKNSNKIVYVSRMYYKAFRETIEETRLKK